MKTFTLSQAQEQVLRDQVIDMERPGPVLRDFHTVLDFVGTEGVPAGGKYNLLPIEAIGPLDERLSRPLRLQLKRPQLRSHPYLQGLQLLFRASGLSRVAGTGSKARLAVDAAALACWRQLNATEQYFTLLEAWLRVGQPEMVGEKGQRWREGFLGDCLQTWRFIPAEEQKLEHKPGEAVYFLGIGRNLYHLALMDLFGLMQVEHPRSAVQPWAPARIGHVPFGDAVFTLLGQRLFSWMTEAVAEDENEDDEDERTGAPDFGRWQPIFQPYFPEWQNNLVLPGTAAREGIFIFRVSLGKTWRRIAMPADASLDDLVSWVLRSVHFDSDHLYEFRYRDHYGATVHAQHPYSDEGPWASEVLIGELPLDPGQSMELMYDFGDSWKFTVKLEQIEPPNARRKAPRILERHGKGPPQYPSWD